ncbi:RNA polymerase sigma-70 factor [Paenibacillus cymbidii]|uniref:RNA polymerase sigma-70 factor n=1 Tax=Paenibacillus cymbidii TaxID=1639034 RepID=UPI001080765B|nr:RNA polymerase sigma-70 factor [Paenibacillus cymbidii]
MEHAATAEQLYTTYKPLLFSLAYRMLGHVMDAEDIVQEAFVAWNGAASAEVGNSKAYLCKIVTNRCIDLLRSSRHRREVYVGPWLPEPIVAGAGGFDPSERYLQQESVTTAYLLLLQQLSWVERAVFLLREAMQFDYGDIAAMVGKSETNCRQIFHRAKRAIGALPPEQAGARAPVGGQATSAAERFVQALASGNIGTLLAALADDAVLYSDGGGKVKAAVQPILGPDRIARFSFGLLAKAGESFSFRLATVGGQPGIVTYEEGNVTAVFTFRLVQDRIANIYIIVNPDKLRRVT